MAHVEARINELGLELPNVPQTIGNYVGAVRTGNLLFLSGRLPRREGKFVSFGKLGKDVTLQEGYDAARLTALNLVATLKAELGDLDRVKRVVKLVGMVNSEPDFTDQPNVLNGASDVLVEIFGNRGRHARSAFGVAALPMNASVEIEVVVEVED